MFEDDLKQIRLNEPGRPKKKKVVLLELFLREHNLCAEDGHFKEHSKVYDIILNSPMRG